MKPNGDAMRRLYSLLSILILASLLAGCAASANAQSEESKDVDSSNAPTDVPGKSNTTDSVESEVVPHKPPASCPITHPADVAFIPPEPYPSKPPERYVDQFWYGTPELWTMLRTDATWTDLPHNRYGYTQKVFWWSRDFDVATDPYPSFKLVIERLDLPSSPVVVSEEATNASADFGTAMLTGVDIPELGCWKITGQYKEAELSFVVWVAP